MYEDNKKTFKINRLNVKHLTKSLRFYINIVKILAFLIKDYN